MSELTMIDPPEDFSARVMSAVQREAHAPAPIPFPWKRLALGAAALLAVSAVALAAAAKVQPVASEPLVDLQAAAGAILGLLILGAVVGVTSRLASR